MKIFVSYSHQDRPRVNLIVDRLQQAGHEVWIDNIRIKLGDNIAERINEGISTAEVVLVVVSKNSMSSKWVQQEFSSIALSEISKRQPKVIPLLIDAGPVPSYLANYYFVDLTRDFEGGLNLLVDSLAPTKRSKETVQVRRTEESRKESQSTQHTALSNALRMGRLTVVAGAGVSVGAGVPVWTELLLRLLESMIDRLSENKAIKLGNNAAKEFSERQGASSLILGKYLKNNLGKDFSKYVRDALYAKNPTTCDVIDAIVELARPQRDGKPLDSIITFNFDALIEENLAASRIPARAIYTEAIRHSSDELPIYHVHGYLPRSGKVSAESEIVFSEDAYHGQFIDPFSWSNLIQLNKLTHNTCLFVGISLTDPNLRRLLDVAWRKNPDKTLSHFVFKRRPKWGSKNDALDDLTTLLEEQDANALGLNVVWVDEYAEIPEILRSVRRGG
ncbi:MAG: molecular chaperone Tir [Betaproteobacteria bacterium HGW-Betaproteobacteria-4]|jgi:hypothetical protein|nr:MAG: molecular chaperone Tir [Betaproteobacteria bacterium HGW-Betaproteobacteria-4]